MYSKLVSTLLGRHRKDKKQNTSVHPSSSGHAPLDTPCILLPHTVSETYNMPLHHFELTWNVKYLGSFPISNLSLDHVSGRLETFQSPHARPATLCVSASQVSVHSEQTCLMQHSLTRVCSVIGRHAEKQVAYIALENAGQTYRKLCHVFRTEDSFQVEEVESVLGNAFQAALLSQQQGRQASNRPNSMHITNSEGIEGKRTSSTAFLSRLLGRNHMTDTEQKHKRKRRPVSAVFSSAINRLSTTSVAQKRMTTIESSSNSTTTAATRITSPVPEEPVPSKTQRVESRLGREEVLVWDEKLEEYIYPLDEALDEQLKHVNYFVKAPTRDLLSRNLLSKPEGAFVVRYSGSMRRYLALSMRVPLSHNASGISHFAIIRNKEGYRIKGSTRHFSSLPALVTHHTVMDEHLPVPLVLVQWHAHDWTHSSRDSYHSSQYQQNNHSHHKIRSYDMSMDCKRQSQMFTRLPDIDENRNSKYLDDLELRRRSRIHVDYRNSRVLVDID